MQNMLNRSAGLFGTGQVSMPISTAFSSSLANVRRLSRLAVFSLFSVRDSKSVLLLRRFPLANSWRQVSRSPRNLCRSLKSLHSSWGSSSKVG
ncbi:hypothetical protein [Klebsiella phage Kpn74]|uniref:Uncharacterized protein n=1 Tax=Klebsiella phage Kpn74 TaxID=3044026 RepID=A0AAT9V579_9CAUD|nr:hypothetical protein [Klebsiella phage Kpn74]